MKKLALIFALISLSCRAQQDSVVHVEEISSEYISNCEQGISCEKLEIIRKASDKKLILIVPVGGTQTDLFLFSFEEIKKASGFVHPNFDNRTERAYDLSDFKDGTFNLQYMACSLGASFQIRITTKD